MICFNVSRSSVGRVIMPSIQQRIWPTDWQICFRISCVFLEWVSDYSGIEPDTGEYGDGPFFCVYWWVLKTWKSESRCQYAGTWFYKFQILLPATQIAHEVGLSEDLQEPIYYFENYAFHYFFRQASQVLLPGDAVCTAAVETYWVWQEAWDGVYIYAAALSDQGTEYQDYGIGAAYPPKYDELPYFTAEGTTGDRFGKFRESVVSAEFFLYVGFQRIVSELKFSCMSVKDRKEIFISDSRGRIVIKISFWGFILLKGRYSILCIFLMIN